MIQSDSPGPADVLVGSDLSEASDRVIQEAARIAERGGSRLHVVSAYPRTVSPIGQGDEEPSEAVVREVRQALPAQLKRILPEDRQPQTQEVRFGSAAKVILERAGETEAEVVILGPHRGRDVHAQFLGTTVDEVLRFAEVPCLTLRGTLPIPLRRIGVATDFSRIGDQALDQAVRWAKWLGASEGSPGTIVCAVHVLMPNDRSTKAQCKADLERGLAAFGERRALPASVTLSSEVLIEADVPAAVVRWAERGEVDLVVVGTHGKSGWQRSNLGSVSSEVARRAPCPVLLVPASDRSRADGER